MTVVGRSGLAAQGCIDGSAFRSDYRDAGSHVTVQLRCIDEVEKMGQQISSNAT